MAEKKHCGTPSMGETLSRCFCFIVTTMPFILPFLAWQYWYLRPFVIYASLLPYCFLPLVLICTLPCVLCKWLGVVDQAKLVLVRCLLAPIWNPYARIMHGYEVKGLENIPLGNKGALIVYYHGVIPVDAIFLAGVVYKKLGRLLGGTVHRGTLKIPMLGELLRIYDYHAEGRARMIEDLKQGALRSVSPGGTYEAMFSENYSIEFGKRCGFAAAAKEARVPIIPMFTENLREYHRFHFFGCRDFFRYLFKQYRMPSLWAFGGLPVKLRTHLGKPMYCGENETAEEFAKRVVKAIEKLRDTHQKMDGSMLRALMDRFE